MWDEITYPLPNFSGAAVWSLGMDKYFHPTLYWVWDYLSMLGIELIHVTKSDSSIGPRQAISW